MARPQKHNLDYFPLDVDCFDDHKILSIEEQYGVKGGYLAIRILAMVYKDHGYYLDWPDNFEVTVAKRVGNGYTGALVAEIFKSCLKFGLFDADLFEKYKVVTSAGIQKRWKTAMDQMRRKVSVSSQYWLITSEETGISSEETNLKRAESTQKEKKGKEMKRNESTSAPPAAAPPKVDKLGRGKNLPPEPYWQELVKTFFDFYQAKFNREKPSFDGKLTRDFKTIIQRLKKRAADRKREWTEANACASLNYFLAEAFKDDWLSRHFTISNLLNQFDSVFQRAAADRKKPNTSTRPILPQTFDDEVKYFLGRYQEGELNSALLSEDFCRKLAVRSGQNIDLATYPGNTEADRLRAAVISIFASISNKEVPA